MHQLCHRSDSVLSCILVCADKNVVRLWQPHRKNAPLPTRKTIPYGFNRDNPRLTGVLPRDYARPGLDTARRGRALSTFEATPQSLSAAKDNQRLGELIDVIDVIATIELTAASEGEKTHRSVDLIGRVYDWSGAIKPEPR